MGKKDKRKGKKSDVKTNTLGPTWDPATEVSDCDATENFNVERYECYTRLDADVADQVRHLKEKMMEAATAGLDFRTFVHECTTIGARAVVLASAVDLANGQLDLLKRGMIRANNVEQCNVPEATEVPGTDRRS
jgi:hypothetical protein